MLQCVHDQFVDDQSTGNGKVNGKCHALTVNLTIHFIRIKSISDTQIGDQRFGIGFKIDPASVETNIIVFDVSASRYSVQDVVNKLKHEGVLMIPFGQHYVRAVTHLDISKTDIEKTISIVRNLFL